MTQIEILETKMSPNDLRLQIRSVKKRLAVLRYHGNGLTKCCGISPVGFAKFRRTSFKSGVALVKNTQPKRDDKTFPCNIQNVPSSTDEKAPS